MTYDRFNREPEKPLHTLNEKITCSPVLLVVEEGENRTMELEEALALAKQQGLDLVLINDKATPPIVKILDYGKFLYEIKKQKGGNKKNVNKVKSVTVKPQISQHDIEWKAEKAIEWFKLGDKVQFIVKAPGRMSERIDLINEVYVQFVDLVAQYGRPKESLKKISKMQYSTYFYPVKK